MPPCVDVRRCAVLLLSVPLLLAPGCAEREGVTSYTVQNLAPDRPAPRNSPSAPSRSGQAWFFKLMGPQTAVQAQADAFARLMATVRFDERGTPVWQAPDGWTERKEQGLRFATLVHNGDPPLEIAISALPSDDPGGDEYLKSNIDRWRGQVGLEPYSGDDWKTRAESAGEYREVEAGGGRVILVQLTGKDQAGAASSMLAAIVPRGAAPAIASPATSAPAQGTPTWTAPAEWTSQPARQFQTALWSASQGDQKVEISVSQSGGSLEANIARWQGQISAAEPAVQEQITVGGAPAVRVELTGAEQSIVGVIVPQEDRAWFFKMMGPAAVVDEEQARFQTFVDSVQFP